MKLELESLHRLHEAEARAAETRQELERVRLQTEIELAEASSRFDEERHGSNSVLSRSELQRRDFGQGPLDYTADWVEKTSVWDPVDHLPLFVDERHSSLSKLPARRSPVVARTDDVAATTGKSLLMERALGLPKLDIPKFNNGTATEYRRFRSLFQLVFDDFPTMSEERKFRYLCSYVQGRAYRVIFPFENTDKPFTQALAALDKRYERMDVLTDEVMTKIERLPAVTEKDLDALHDFSQEVNSKISLMEAVGQPNEIRSTMLPHRLLSKLPESRQLEFRRHCLARGISTSATTFDLGRWLEDLEEAILMVRPLSQLKKAETTPSTKKTHKPTGPLPSAAVLSTSSGARSKPSNVTGSCLFCKHRHWLSQCSKFRALSLAKKKEWSQSEKRCEKCGETAHPTDSCTFQIQCKSCSGVHLNVLHDVVQQPSTEADNTVHAGFTGNQSTVALKIVPVTLHGPKGRCDTYAVLDDGSQRTLLSADVVETLGLHGTTERLAIATYEGAQRIHEGLSVNVDVSPADNPNERFTLHEAFAVHRLALPSQRLNVAKISDSWTHLNGLPMVANDAARTPQVLIGSDHADLIIADEVRRGPKDALIAVHTALGWLLQGKIPATSDDGGTPTQTSSCLFTSTNAFDKLNETVEQFWKVDSLGTKAEQRDAMRSKQDHQAVTRLDEETRRVEVDGVRRYEVPFLWQDERPMPTTTPRAGAFLMAFRRGTPRELWLDRGTNFVGGRNEFADALSKMEPQVAKQLADKGTAFKFITPSAPTHGGAWEREVKSVKAALCTGLKDHRVSEPVLRTLFVEVEGVLNSKPLTYVSTDAQDPDPITPQMLLTGRADHSLPPATYPDDEMLTRRRWRQSQVLANRFWRRFIREYLPTIQSRRKCSRR